MLKNHCTYATFWGSWTIIGHTKSKFIAIFGVRNQLHSLLNYCDSFCCTNTPEVILKTGVPPDPGKGAMGDARLYRFLRA